MHRNRIAISLSILVLASLACKAVTGLGLPQTGIPAVLTEMPATLEAAATQLGEITPPAVSTSEPATNEPAPTSQQGNNSSAPTSGLGINVEDVKTVMQASQQFSFSDETVDGQPAVVAKLSDTALKAMPAGSGFSAAFIGDQANLGEIKITVPYSSDQSTIEAGLGMVTVLFASILPADVLFTFLPWLTENYSKVPEGGSEELSAGKFHFTLSRTQTDMLLDIVPAQ